MVTEADTTSSPTWALDAASDLLKRQKGLGSKGPVRDAIAARLAGSEGAAAPAEDDLQAQTADAEALLEAFTSRRFSAASLERMVASEPQVLSRVEPAAVAELLDVLAKACFLPNRVVTLIEATPRILTDISTDDLRQGIVHMKQKTSPMGSQLAAMWEKDPRTLWLDAASIDERLDWLRELGVKGDRVRFIYARLPAVFTADKEHFQPKLDYLTGLDLNIGELLTKRPHYLEWSTERLQKMEPKLTAEFRRRGTKKTATAEDVESD